MAVFSQTGGTSGGSYASYFTGKLTVTEESYSVANNTSTVSWKLELVSGSSGKFSDYYIYSDVYINGQHVLDDEGYKAITTANTSLVLGSGTITIAHDSDGSKTISCSATIDSASGTYSPGNFSLSGTLDLTDIPRYPSYVWESLNSKTVNSVKMAWSSDCIIDYIWYSKDNGSTWTGIDVTDGTSGSYTISNLSPNTTYKIKTRARRKDSQLTKDSSVLSVTTYDIARLTNYPSFNLGDNVTINYTNPSGADIQVGIYDLAGAIGYAPYRDCSGNSYTFDFTEAELDKIYKALGTSNSGKFLLYISTANTYSDTKEITITLAGNQKTGHTNVDGAWKRTKRWINVDGTWKRCVRWVNVDGSWKRCI